MISLPYIFCIHLWVDHIDTSPPLTNQQQKQNQSIPDMSRGLWLFGQSINPISDKPQISLKWTIGFKQSKGYSWL